MMDNELPIFVKWMDFLKWLFSKTEKFPKKVRFTISMRMENMALDIVEALTEARYSKKKSDILKKININLEKLRILFRIAYEEHYVSDGAYQYGIKNLNEMGRMLGGWIKSRDQKQ